MWQADISFIIMKPVLGRTIYIKKIHVLVSALIKFVNKYNYNLYVPQFFSLEGGWYSSFRTQLTKAPKPQFCMIAKNQMFSPNVVFYQVWGTHLFIYLHFNIIEVGLVL